tara:strand:+ start:203 stop:697 length:495 start_codon:yes stop_codon:yes gene_type:complete
MGKPQTPEHRARIAAAMRAYHKSCKDGGASKVEKVKKELKEVVKVAKEIKKPSRQKEWVAKKSGYVKKPIVTKLKKRGRDILGKLIPRSLPPPSSSKPNWKKGVEKFEDLLTNDLELDADDAELYIMEISELINAYKGTEKEKTVSYADLKEWRKGLKEFVKDN